MIFNQAKVVFEPLVEFRAKTVTIFHLNLGDR